jgi:hypothetical protein
MLKYIVDGNQLAAVVVLPTGAAPSPVEPPLELPLDPPLDPPLELPLDPPLDPPLEPLLPSAPAEASPFDELDPPLECPHAASAISETEAARTTFRMAGLRKSVDRPAYRDRPPKYRR